MHPARSFHATASNLVGKAWQRMREMAGIIRDMAAIKKGATRGTVFALIAEMRLKDAQVLRDAKSANRLYNQIKQVDQWLIERVV